MATNLAAKENFAATFYKKLVASKIEFNSCLLTVGLFLILWNLPTPAGLSVQAWNLFSIFLTIIFAIVAKPLPMGALMIVAITTCTVSKTLTIDQALSGYSSKVIWLVFTAFLLAKGFVKTGLGSRIAYYFIYNFGKSTLGLSYGLTLIDLLLAPFIPSNTARGAGIIFPIISALNKEYNSLPEIETEKKIGSYLISLSFNVNVITSSMFVTSMAVNPLIVSFAPQFGINISWFDWAKAAFVPGVICLALLPLILYKINPPQIKRTPEAKELAKAKLTKMGPLTGAEKIMLFTFSGLILLWIFDSALGIDPTTTALLGLTILLVTGVLTWEDVLLEKGAWDSFMWLATLLTLTTYLAKFGFMSWFSNHMQQGVASYNWGLATFILALIYFYSHYFFASLTAHVSTMYVPFVLVSVAVGAPPMLAALLFAFLSSLCASITHYGCGSAPVFFSANYLSLKEWWKIGAIVSTVNLIIFLSIGSIWWKFIGIW